MIELIINLLIAILLVLLNGFFVASEFSIVKLRETRVAALKSHAGLRGMLLAKIHNDIDSYLSVCQLGITLASLGLGWIGEPAFGKLLKPIFSYFKLSLEVTHGLSLSLAFLIISYLHIVIGELVPKTLSIRKSEAVSLWCAPLLYFSYRLMYPAIVILNNCSNLTLYLLGLRNKTPDAQPYTKEEIKHILKTHVKHRNMANDAKLIVEKAVEFSERYAADLMEPDEKMIVLDSASSIEDNISIICKHRYSRYPVFQNNRNNIIGIVHVKDFFSSQHVTEDYIDFKSIIRPIIFVDITQPAIAIFNEFKKGVSHFAIVKSNEIVVGFITLDNVLKALVGDIKDEFNTIEPKYIKTKEKTFIMKGTTPIYMLEEELNITISDNRAHTLAGLVMNKLQRFPVKGEKVEFKHFDIHILKIHGPRIELIKVYPKRIE